MKETSQGTGVNLSSILTNSILLSHYLEKITEKIFQNSGFDLISNCNISKNNVDIIAKESGKLYYIEVKTSTSVMYRHLSMLENAINKIVHFSNNDNAIPVLVVFSVISDKVKNKYSVLYKDLIILDISNLLYAVQGTELRDELISILPFSVDQIEPQKGAINLSWLIHSDDSSSLIKRFEDCLAGNRDATKFEDVCFDVLSYIFPEDLSLWKKQKQSNNNLYRFDLLCRIKDNNLKTFWIMMEKYFNSKYIVFEFKNYSNKITQKEIYTTERYLYAKALRNVAIIIARSGFDDNSIWAAKGCLRENGKLILLITVDDLKEMYYLKKEQQDPSEYLLHKLDSMLADLEK